MLTILAPSSSVIFVLNYFLVLVFQLFFRFSFVLVFIIFFILVLVFVNEFVIFSFFAIFVFVNENHTAVNAMASQPRTNISKATDARQRPKPRQQ